MKQLHLTENKITGLGFKKYVIGGLLSYRIDTINGWFYYNPAEERYVWYHCTQIEDGYNHIHLNIQTKDELKTCLKVFDAKTKIEKIELLRLKNSNSIPCPVPYPYYPVPHRWYDPKPDTTWEISSTNYPITATPVIFI